MDIKEKEYLKSQLDSVYQLLNKLENSKVKGTTEYNIVFELENINIKLDIPFTEESKERKTSDKLYDLANKIDDINYNYDTYSYMDNLDDTESIYEGRQKATKEIYIDLIEGNIEHYIEFLKGIITEGEVMEGYPMEHVQEVLEELEEYKDMSMTIEVKGEKFIVDYHFKKMTESEVEELKQSLGSCNWNNFNSKDILYFASGSQSANYDFIVHKVEGYIFLTQW